ALVMDGNGWTKVLALSAHEREAFRERSRRPGAVAPEPGETMGEAEAAAGTGTPRADGGLDALAARPNGSHRGSPGPAVSNDSDVRTPGRRLRRAGEEVQGWPLDDPPAAVHFCARVERAGRVPSGWLDKWSQSKNIAVSDLVYYELRTIIDALEYAGSYDQALVDADEKNPSKPCFENAKYFSGFKSSSNAVSPDLKNFAARKAKGDTEVEKQRQNVKELRGKTESGKTNAEGGRK
ncbi:unnamed protein product, partial [Prorocentrum cordatum]